MREKNVKYHWIYFCFVLLCLFVWFLPVKAEESEIMVPLIYEPNISAVVKGMPQNSEGPLHSVVPLSSSVPQCSGYIFKGWGNSPLSQDPLSEIALNDMPTTVYAIWEVLPPQISLLNYDPNTQDDVSGMPLPAAARSGAEVLLSKSIPSRRNYDFVEWSLTPDGSQPVTKVLLSESNSTVYAVWDEVLVSKDAGEFFDDFFTSDENQDPMVLPATGFPTRMLPSQRAYFRTSAPIGFELMIPILDVQTDLVLSERQDNTWNVSGLRQNAGLLEGSALPGDGFALIAAHNHLNSAETGPFLFLYALSENDVIFIREPDGTLRRYAVYANELMKPNEVTAFSATASKYAESLALVTCESETAEGTYAYRRVVFAKPL